MTPDKYSIHEVMHLAYVLQNTVENHIVESPIIKSFVELRDKADKANQALADLYEAIGQLDFTEPENLVDAMGNAQAKMIGNQRGRIVDLKKVLRAMAEYNPEEIVYDQFAYERLLENFKETAKKALEKDKETIESLGN